MSLPVPIVGQEIGPQWASDLNSCMSVIDGHNHVPGSGVQVPSAGLNINADLLFNSNNATLIRAARFVPQTSAITSASPDVGELYVVNSDLYYNDISGNQIRITQGGSVTGSSGTITGLPSGTASASYASGTFVFQQSTGVAANLDTGTLIIRYPGSYPSPAGNAILIEAPSSLSSQYSIVLPALPSSTRVLSITTAGVLGTGVAAIIQGSELVNQTITATQIANSTITGTQLINSINLPGIPTGNGKALVLSFSASDPSNLAVMRGVINTTGGIIQGTGFSCIHTGTGQYTIIFGANFGDIPSVVVNPYAVFGSTYIAVVSNIAVGSCSLFISTLVPSVAPVDSDFSFIAIGSRNP